MPWNNKIPEERRLFLSLLLNILLASWGFTVGHRKINQNATASLPYSITMFICPYGKELQIRKENYSSKMRRQQKMNYN